MTRAVWLGAILLTLAVTGAAAVAGLEAPDPKAVRTLLEAGSYGNAEEAARLVLRSLESATPSDPRAVAEALDLLSESLWRGGKSKQDEALVSAERALTLKEKALGIEDPALIPSLQNVANVLRLRGDLARAQAPLDRALAIAGKSQGGEGAEVIRILNSLGNLLKDRGDLAGSTEYYSRALRLSEAAYGPDHRQVAVLLNNLATNDQESGEFARAVPLHERAIAIMKTVHQGAGHPEVAHVINAYANTLWQLGDYRQARLLHEEALEMREAALGPEHHSVAASLNNLALVLKAQGDLTGARPYLERAVAIWEKGSGPEHPLTAQGYNNLGTLTASLGDLDRARGYQETALRIREKQLGPEHPLVAQTLINLGNVLALLGDTAAATPLLERSIAVAEKTIGADSPQVAMARQDLGQILLDTGRIEPARTQLERALAIRELSLGPGHPLVGETLSSLGELCRKAGEFEKAREYQVRALAVSEASLGRDHPQTAITRTMLAAADFDLGRFDEARAEAAAGAASAQQHLRNTLGAVSEREALLLIGGQQHAEVTLFSGLLADEVNRRAWVTACWNWALQQRGLVLEEMAARRRAALVGDTIAVREAWQRLVEARRLLAATWVRGVEAEDRKGSEPYQARLERATRNKDAAEIEMSRASARYREEREALRATLADVAGALPEGAALVEVVRVPVRSPRSRDEASHDIALILKKDGTADFTDLGTSSGSDDLVAAWRKVLDETASGIDEEAGAARIRQAGWRLRSAIWEPIAARTRGAGTIFLVPEASLWTLNVAALPAEDGTFLIENGPTVRLLGAARDLVRSGLAAAASGADRGRGVLLLGAPDFGAPEATRIAGIDPARRESLFRGAPSVCGSLARREWRNLPEAGKEIARVESLFRKAEPVSVLSGAQASEERFKLEAPGKRILHLATHGYFLGDRCASGDREDPLLLSGLVLAGANAPPGARSPAAAPAGGQAPAVAAVAVDDGVLTAEEVSALDLRGADLAVLSACDTGRGEVQVGEGVFGLQRSLELAGVRAVVMSLWPVPDREARRWMTPFYESLLAGAPVGEAARKASLAALERLRAADRSPHPYYWGAFVSAGDWRATVPPLGRK